MMTRIKDARLHIIARDEQKLCVKSLAQNIAVSLQYHHGIVVDVVRCAYHEDCALIKLKHTGEQTCSCKAVVIVNDEDLYR